MKVENIPVITLEQEDMREALVDLLVKRGLNSHAEHLKANLFDVEHVADEGYVVSIDGVLEG